MKVIDFAKKLISENIDFTTFKIDMSQPAESRKTINNTWKSKQATIDILKNFNRGDNGIALKTGRPNGGVILLDFDNHRGDVEEIYNSFMGAQRVKDVIEQHNFYVEKTQSGGYHILFKCEEIGANKVLAKGKMAGKKEGTALIETREDGGLCFIAPSGGYTQISGSIFDLPLISVDEKNELFECAMAFHEVFDTKEIVSYVSATNDKPSDILHDDPGLCEQLIRAELSNRGWVENSGGWRRPGKNKGVSGIINTAGKITSKDGQTLNFPTFKCFSTSTELDNKLYTPFSLIATLSFNGDWSKCAAWLIDMGYVKRQEGEKIINESGLKDSIIKALRDGEKIGDIKQGLMFEWMREFSMTEKNISKILKNIYSKHKDLFGFNKLPLWEKVKKAVGYMYYIYHDEIRDVPYFVEKNAIERNINDFNFFKKKPFRVLNPHTIFGSLLDEYGVNISLDKLRTFLKNENYIPRINVFKNYFDSLPRKTGFENVNKLLACIHLEDEGQRKYFNSMFIKHLARLYVCATNDRYENRYCFSLISEERSGKTKFLQYLNPLSIEYFTETKFDVNSKDHINKISTNLIISIDEIDRLRDQDSEALKNLISASNQNDRMAFKEFAKSYIRRASFFASANKHFLKAGENTRFLVFDTVGKYNWQEYTKININDIYAEIVNYVRSGGEIELTQEEENIQNSTNRNSINLDLLDSLLLENFEYCSNSELRASEVIGILIGKLDKDTYMSYKISGVTMGKSLNKLFPAKRTRLGMLYYVKQKNT